MSKKITPTREQVIAALGVHLAEQHFEVNQEIYQEDAEGYADAGTTEAMYMAGSSEHIRPQIEQDIANEIADEACKHYEKLVRAKYPRVKSKDFVW